MTTTTTSIARGKYHIWTVGCQMNQADSQRIQTLLDELGWEETSMDQANLVILNTCSVRKAPEEKAHNQLAQLKHAKSKRSDLLVALMGCMIGNQKTIDDLGKRPDTVHCLQKGLGSLVAGVKLPAIYYEYDCALAERLERCHGRKRNHGCLVDFCHRGLPTAAPAAPYGTSAVHSRGLALRVAADRQESFRADASGTGEQRH